MSPPAGAGVAVARRTEAPLLQEVERAADTASDFLLNRQQSQGCWAGALEGDCSLEADYILLQLWLYGPNEDGTWTPPTRRQVDGACTRILRHQLPSGGWSIFEGGPPNVSASVKAYAALKLAGLPADDERLRRAAACILSLGGVEASNSYAKLYLSYFDLYDRSKVPSIPPEIFLLPEHSRWSVYRMSSWSRAMLAPLSILNATNARRPVPTGVDLHEIHTGTEPEVPERLSWKGFFLLLDRSIKFLESTDLARNRTRGIEAAESWMVARLDGSEGLGAIFPAMANAIMALTQLGYDQHSGLLRRQIQHFGDLIADQSEEFRIQPCHSPVWDTAMTAYSIGRAQRELSEPARWALSRSADWLLSKQALRRGDWSVTNPNADPGGWYFEYKNEHYPDTDDTAKVLLALEWAHSGDRERQAQAEDRAIEWLVAMQSSDGGWAAFDVDSTANILTQVPFADHNAMLDPTCADITGRVLEALCRRAPGRYESVKRRGIEFLRRSQEFDGCWYGRWGVNYLYGTCFALRGLRAAGVAANDAAILQAGEWVRSVQRPDGGWGESAASYDDPSLRGGGPSTPSQTAWALLALFAAGDFESGSVREGLRYLLEKQNDQGSWSEREFTGTGFPRVFYLRYHMYAQYFPLIALGEYLHGATGDRP